jgi:hypothetical protein
MMRGLSRVDINASPSLQMFALLSLIVLIGLFYAALRREPESNERVWRLIACDNRGGTALMFEGPTQIYAKSAVYFACHWPIGTEFFRQDGYLWRTEFSPENYGGRVNNCFHIVAEIRK